VFFFVFLILHAALWIWSVVIWADEEFRIGCKDLNEHYFFVKVYALVVAGILIIMAGMIGVLVLPAAVLTVKSFRNRGGERE
jgi:hypothetical protein